MAKLDLTFAICSYDHVRDVFDGSVPIEGIDLNHLDLPVEEIFHRFITGREWEVSEISMGKFSALVSAGETDLVGIPVFPSRTFRHAGVYVRTDGEVATAEQLRGRRIGVPEWAQTASVYSRALLQHRYGVPPDRVQWVQAGVDQPGRREKVDLALPPGVEVEVVGDRSLSQMLLAGELDAVLSAHTPGAFTHGQGAVRRLFAEPRLEEQAYWEETGIFPIMHTVAVRRDVVERHPWVPTTLFKALTLAKRRSVDRVLDYKQSRFPVPWGHYDAAATYARFGDEDPWPYGVRPNRKTLEAFLGFACEQGVLQRPVEPEELFPLPLEDGFRV